MGTWFGVRSVGWIYRILTVRVSLKHIRHDCRRTVGLKDLLIAIDPELYTGECCIGSAKLETEWYVQVFVQIEGEMRYVPRDATAVNTLGWCSSLELGARNVTREVPSASLTVDSTFVQWPANRVNVGGTASITLYLPLCEIELFTISTGKRSTQESTRILDSTCCWCLVVTRVIDDYGQHIVWLEGQAPEGENGGRGAERGVASVATDKEAIEPRTPAACETILGGDVRGNGNGVIEISTIDFDACVIPVFWRVENRESQRGNRGHGRWLITWHPRTVVIVLTTLR